MGYNDPIKSSCRCIGLPFWIQNRTKIDQERQKPIFRGVGCSLARRVVFLFDFGASGDPQNHKNHVFSVYHHKKSKVRPSQEKGSEGIDLEIILGTFWTSWDHFPSHSAPQERKFWSLVGHRFAIEF